MSEGPDERKETNDLDKADDGVDEILNSAEFQDLVARQDEQRQEATDAKRWDDLQQELNAQYDKVGTELYKLDQLDNPDSALSEQNFKDYLTERAKVRYTSSSDSNPFSNIHEMNKSINNEVKIVMDSLGGDTTQTLLQMDKGVPLADDTKGSTGQFEIRFTKPWEDKNERQNIKINNGQLFDEASLADQKEYIKRQEANFKLTESKFSKSFDNFKDDDAKNNKNVVNFVVRHRIEKIKAKAAAEKARSANLEGSAEPPTDNEKGLLSKIEKQANKAEKLEKTAVENNEATQSQLDNTSDARVELGNDIENYDNSNDSNDKDESKQGGGWLKKLAKLLGGVGSIAAVLAFITFVSNKLADKNSGCYMRITQGERSITKSKDCCGECLATDSIGWVEGSILLTNCKMGDRIWYNFIPGANEIGSDWDDEYVGCRNKTLGVCDTVGENNCTGAPQRKSDQVKAPGNNPVFMDVSYDRKQCAADSNYAFCVGTETDKYCTLSSDILEDRLGISSLKGLQDNNKPVLPQLSKRTPEGVNVSYRYHKFDTYDGTGRILKCLGCCANKVGTSMLWFIGILIGLFALYKFIEFEFDEHEGAIHARVKKN
tara:strand:+ start:5095 stop:6900 length:1806 start_codon:yes stop_codon:yes gene_type:complete